ncbi:MAG: polysaccharide deacetylase family protein [Clostridia bacterium]|nr:polysaccharide deacetylase family protein [Clostridia bacterium]MDE7328861.1 polysaccharide deacetylase family protein [Clostridia bacterium]
MKRVLSLVLVCIFALTVVTLAVGCDMERSVAATCFTGGRESLGDLTVIMYHNTLAPYKKESVYCINQNHLREDFEYLKIHGYNVVSSKQVINAAQNGRKLPEKAVMLTFDDGYLNNLKYAAPLLEEYGFVGLFSVVGDYTEFDKEHTPKGSDFVYFGWDDMKEANSNDFIEIGLHSYSLHYTKPRKGVGKISGESGEEYKSMLLEDTDKLLGALRKIGISSNVYAYPFGEYCKESEQVLKSRGIVMTLTCNEGVNHIYTAEDLYLLRRFNRDATKAELREIIG